MDGLGKDVVYDSVKNPDPDLKSIPVHMEKRRKMIEKNRLVDGSDVYQQYGADDIVDK